MYIRNLYFLYIKFLFYVFYILRFYTEQYILCFLYFSIFKFLTNAKIQSSNDDSFFPKFVCGYNMVWKSMSYENL